MPLSYVTAASQCSAAARMIFEDKRYATHHRYHSCSRHRGKLALERFVLCFVRMGGDRSGTGPSPPPDPSKRSSWVKKRGKSRRRRLDGPKPQPAKLRPEGQHTHTPTPTPTPTHTRNNIGPKTPKAFFIQRPKWTQPKTIATRAQHTTS